jgi:hypothetical protein
MNNPKWSAHHVHALQKAVADAGLDIATLSAKFLLSKSQAASLLGADNHAFYTEAIRLSSGIKLLKALRVSPDQIEALSLMDRPPAAEVQAAPVAQTVAASLEPQTSEATTSTPPLSASRKTLPVWGWLGLLVVGLMAATYAAMTPKAPGNALLTVQRPAVDAPSSPNQDALAASLAPTPPATAAAQQPTEQTPTAAISTNTTSPSVSTAVVDLCDFSQPNTALEAVKSLPNLGKGYVHFSAQENTSVCVQDALGKVSKINLLAQTSRSVYGQEPLTVNFDKDNKPTVYYQRNKVYLRADTQQAKFE